MATECEHGAECHDGTEPSLASAPEAARAWLLVEHPGPWAAAGRDAAARTAGRPGYPRRRPRHPRADDPQARAQAGERRAQCLRRLDGRGSALAQARGNRSDRAGPEGAGDGDCPGVRGTGREPVFLVCAHGRRNACCARFGAPLAAALAARHPRQIWETTHVGGHRFAANLVLLPHGLIRPGRRAGGRRRDRRLPAGHDHAAALPRPGGPAEADPGGRVRAAGADRIPRGRRAGLAGLAGPEREPRRGPGQHRSRRRAGPSRA